MILSPARLQRCTPAQQAVIADALLAAAYAREWLHTEHGRPLLPYVQYVFPVLGNAERECGFNPRAVGDGGHAFGLYQFNDASRTSLGTQLRQAGWTTDQLQDAYMGTFAILFEATRYRQFTGATSIAAAVDAFTRYAERPAAVDRDAATSVRMATAWCADPAWMRMRPADVERITQARAPLV